MSEVISVRAGTYNLFSSDAPGTLLEACAGSPAKVLELMQDSHHVDIATGWTLLSFRKSSGVANLRAIRSDDCALLFGGVSGSSWYPADQADTHAVLAKGVFSVRVRGPVESADAAVSDEQWAARPLSHRAGYYAVRAAQGTPASPRALSEALNSGLVNGALTPDSMSKRPDDWRCFWVTPTEVRFTFLGENRVHRYIDFTRTWAYEPFTISRNA